MHDFYSQPIGKWVKQNSSVYCAKALVEKDLRGFIRHFCFSLMTRNNVVITHKPITLTISELGQGTWSTVTVQRELAKMAKEGEFKRHGTKQIKWNPTLGNRVINYKGNLGYEGPDIVLNEAQLRVIETLRNMLKHQNYDTHEDEMKAALKKIDKLEEKLDAIEKESKIRHQELMNILKGNAKPEEIVEKVKRHLELVK
jgi:hypothetical protein